MYHHDRAEAEQLHSLISPEQGVSELSNRAKATVWQITGYRRRTETILNGMVDLALISTPQQKRVRGRHNRAAKKKKINITRSIALKK
mgnify:CR=1 FL=1